MRVCIALATLGAVLSLWPAGGVAAGIPAFYGDPPDAHHPWAVHDPNRPQPRVVTPGTFSSQAQPGRPPSDAIVLFDGTDLSKWKSAKEEGGPAKWLVKGGLLQVEPKSGDIRTKEEFGDCQLHIEWAEPKDVSGSSQGRGNSGIFLMGLYEIQVLDCYHSVTYADGQAGALYGSDPPLVNALRPPGRFQVYDIIFRRAIYREGKLLDPGYVTVFVNGVLVQDHTQLEGPTLHMKRTHPCASSERGPLVLQDHGNPVRFRNIWYRPLPPRAIEGGTDGYLSVEATMAKRKQIAAAIRQDAAHLKSPARPVAEMLRLAESLEYEKDPATVQTVERMGAHYVAAVKELPPTKLAGKKDEVKHVNSAFHYLVEFGILPALSAPQAQLQQIIKEHRWDKD